MVAVVKVAVDVLNKEECKKAKSLWEEVFFEDSVQFTDYYFKYKAEKNTGYVIGQAPYNAMVFRTPYPLQIGKIQREISYLVGVATRKECRHRGYMRTLLMHSFEEMYQEKMPFTFLMPANPAIYEPFDFKYIYERDIWQLRDPEKEIETMGIPGLYSIQNFRKKFPKIPILKLLAEFANGYLKEHYNIYVHRDISYYEMQLKELEAQNGDIYVLWEEEKIKAFFLYAKEEEEIFIQEVMETEEGILEFLQKKETKKPIIMARVIHMEEMLKLVCCNEYKKLILKVEDELIPQNAGVYEWEITPTGSLVTKLLTNTGEEKRNFMEMKAAEQKTEETEISMHIRDLAPRILTGVFINEIV